MRFCSQCGKTISILDTSGANYCPDCSPGKKVSPATQRLQSKNENGELFSASFIVKEGKLHLVSKEGWLLWSGDISAQHSLQQVTDRASRILNIRKRKKK